MTTMTFWNNMADKYAARAVSDEASYAATLDVVRGVLPEGADVVELGCGTGSTALRLAGDVGQYLGTDYAPRMIEIATQKALDAGAQNVRFQVTDADSDLGAQFDAVLMFNLLHLLNDVTPVLREAHKSLKTGGIVISKSGCLGVGAKHLLRLPIWLLRLFGKAPFVAFHSPAQLDAMFEAAGFKIERAEMFPAKGMNRLIVARKL